MDYHSKHRYRLVDVFTQERFQGNTLAVFPNARDIGERQIQLIARELNLPETTFVLSTSRNGCGARVHFVTPAKEMVFAGHRTLGTAYILMAEKRVASLVTEFCLELPIGAVPVRIEREESSPMSPMLWLQTPPVRWERAYEAALCADALGLSLQDVLDVPPPRLNAGNPTLLIAVRDPSVVDRAALSSEGMRRLRDGEAAPFCVFVFAPTPTGAYTRMFAPDYGIPEDPAQGSSIGPLAAYMIRHNLIAPNSTTWVSEQGTRMKRRSLLHVRLHGYRGAQGIEVGGHVTTVGEGMIELP